MHINILGEYVFQTADLPSILTSQSGLSSGRALTLGSRNFLMFSAEAEAKQYSVGCRARPRTLFLWYVRVAMALPLRRSHSFTVLSCDPVITCSSRWPLTHEGSMGWGRGGGGGGGQVLVNFKLCFTICKTQP